uniref:SUI1 domain-containing protein n=1 Tax=Steinernema glaseri TaxID=37863 RepID=A0A1I7ZT37_9BILA
MNNLSFEFYSRLALNMFASGRDRNEAPQLPGGLGVAAQIVAKKLRYYEAHFFHEAGQWSFLMRNLDNDEEVPTTVEGIMKLPTKYMIVRSVRVGGKAQQATEKIPCTQEEVDQLVRFLRSGFCPCSSLTLEGNSPATLALMSDFVQMLRRYQQ